MDVLEKLLKAEISQAQGASAGGMIRLMRVPGNRLKFAGFTLAVIIFQVVVVWKFVWVTVARDRKDVGDRGHEYRIQKRFSDDRLRVWFDGQLAIDDPKDRLVTVVEQHWECRNEAVYLDLKTSRDLDSYSAEEELKILYDFRTGDLYSTAQEQSLEFDKALIRIQDACGPRTSSRGLPATGATQRSVSE